MQEGLIAVYAGSFDPVTFGHLDLIERAGKIFDHLVIAIGVHPTRRVLFSFEERVELLREVTRPIENIRIDSFDGLLIDYCAKIGARVIVSGLRAATDFEYELQIAHANADLAPGIDTIFLPTRTNYGFVSASLVREIAIYGGNVSQFVDPLVAAELRRKCLKS